MRSSNPTFVFRVSKEANLGNRGSKQMNGAMSRAPSRCVIQLTLKTRFFGYVGKKRVMCRNLHQIVKNAGRNRAGIFVMGNFLDQTARAAADRKALSAVTDDGSTLTPMKSCKSQAFVGTPWKGSHSKDLRGGFFYLVTQSTRKRSLSHVQMTSKIANIQLNSPEATSIGISPNSHEFFV